jgi:hypothetical protein
VFLCVCECECVSVWINVCKGRVNGTHVCATMRPLETWYLSDTVTTCMCVCVCVCVHNTPAADTALASKLAVRCSSFICSEPLARERINAPSSLPKGLKYNYTHTHTHTERERERERERQPTKRREVCVFSVGTQIVCWQAWPYQFSHTSSNNIHISMAGSKKHSNFHIGWGAILNLLWRRTGYV